MAHTSCMLDKQGYMHSRSYTHKHVTFFAFPLQQLFANVRHCYVIRTLPVLFVYCVSSGQKPLRWANRPQESCRVYLFHCVIKRKSYPLHVQ
jgi:hypothetical protein